MAAANLKIFENFPLLANPNLAVLRGIGSLHIHAFNIPGSISFNSVIHPLRVSITGTRNATINLSFGLYSLNGSTLSLANSASRSLGVTGGAANSNSALWITLATSATQNITPGTWWFACMSSTSINAGAGTFRYYVGSNPAVVITSSPGGVFVRGALSVSTAALPASIATTDMNKEGNADVNIQNHPAFIISA